MDPTEELLPPYNRLNGPTFAELARNRNGGAGFSRMGSALGQAFAGLGSRDSRNEQMFNRGATQAADMQEKLNRARLITAQAIAAESKNSARSHIRENLVRNGATPEQADMLTSFFEGEVDPRRYGGYQLQNQKLGVGQQAIDAANAGDRAKLNLLMTIFSGKPTPFTKVQNGNVFDPTVPPDEQEIEPTEVAQAQVRAADALAEKRGGAGSSRLTSTMFGPQKPAPLSAEQIKAGFGDSTGRLDSDAYKKFEAWRGSLLHNDPSMANEQAAYSKYAGALGFDPNERPPGSFDVSDAPDAAAAPQSRSLLSNAFNQTSAAPPQAGAASPYAEGTRLRGPDGKTYRVQNGQPIPESQ